MKTGRCETFHTRKHAVFWNLTVLEHKFAGDAGLKECLPFISGALESFVAFLDDKTVDHAVQLRPNNRQIGNGSVSDPHFCPVEKVVVACLCPRPW